MATFTNIYGNFEEGDRVRFSVENRSCWFGDTDGILRYDGNDFYIETKRSGNVSIDKGYDAYSGTIQKAFEG